jgi:hypothetical protein
MTTGRINQVDIFLKQKDRDVQRTTSEPPQHTRTDAFPFAHKTKASKSKNNQRARAVTAIVCIESHSRLSMRKTKTRSKTALERPQSSDTQARPTLNQEPPHALEFPQTRQQPYAIQFHSTKLNWFPRSSNATTFPTHSAHTCLAKQIANTRATHTRRNKFTIETPRSVDVARRNTRPPDRFAQRESRTLTSHHNASNPRVPVTRRSAHSATRIVSIVTVSLCNAYQYNPNKQRACGKRIGFSDTQSATHDKQMPLAEL